MSLPASAHTSQPWRIHEIAPDFSLEDVWALPTPGGPDEFPRLIALFAGGDPSESSSMIARMLFAIRWKLGALMGWDEATTDSATVMDRLPADLRDTLDGHAATAGFTALYRTDDEYAAELVNRTVHAILHLGWVADDTGGYRGQMAVLVAPNGALGAAYMLAIRPLRHLVVYPALIRGIGEKWHVPGGTPG